jgi:DNA-binding transcriptional LysR family regulator
MPHRPKPPRRSAGRLSLEIEIALTADLIQQILAGRTDLVFGAGRIAHPALRTVPIGAVDLLLLANPETVAHLHADRGNRNFPIWSLSSHSAAVSDHEGRDCALRPCLLRPCLALG